MILIGSFANHMSLSIRSAKKAFEENLVTSKDRRKLFRYLRSSLSSKVSIPMVRRSTGEQCDGIAECASIFADVFADSYSIELDGPIPRVRLPRALQSLESFEFSGEEVLSYSASLDVSISPGVGNVSARLKSSAPALLSINQYLGLVVHNLYITDRLEDS
ncbi:hypothetical protein HHI36_011341 [Cryptolaemus montrouzieri]|uniref:Uncharacterized protein n=1 Tax=Cryptolaemus montrouzieri TaxID=559131 RepID=A0ABD2MLI1_9CUCU